MFEYVSKVGIDQRMWRIYAIFSPLGMVTRIKMTYGAAELTFAPDGAYNAITRAGAGVVSAVVALADSELADAGEADDFAVIERW